MKNRTEKAIRIGMLTIMVILGLVAVFPQSLELKDFIINSAENKVVGYKRKVSSLKFKFPSFHNISPSKKELKKQILNLNYVDKLYCIGVIPEIIYSKKDKDKGNKVSSFSIPYQYIVQRDDQLKLKKGILAVSPKYRSVRYGHWLWPSYKQVFSSWQYNDKKQFNVREVALKDPEILSRALNTIRIKTCD